MQKYVQRYLSEYYYIKTSDVGNDGIYKILDDRKYPTPFRGSVLINEISTVFGLEDGESKTLIEIWSVSVKPDVDLNFYWKSNEDLIDFTNINRITATTIALDLVPVQPMDGPKGELFYIDYQYGDNEPVIEHTGTTGRRGPINRNGRLHNEEIFRQSWGDIKRFINEKFGE
jgi:hypothetical protein